MKVDMIQNSLNRFMASHKDFVIQFTYF